VPRQTATSSHHHKWNQIEIHHENQQVAPISPPAAVDLLMLVMMAPGDDTEKTERVGNG